MKLPSDSDYQAALQHPREAFADPELRDGQPELGTGGLAGLPRPRAGNFATVYKLQCGPRAWAVRCFTRAIQPDQQLRYVELIQHLALHRLPYSVDVAFLQQGIHVRGEWLPIVKMEWVQGESLSRHVARHLESPKALFELASQWLDMLAALREAKVAHGDLQHGNVVVTPEGFRLVDYDGMFVPALAGRRSHERGHAHYQHPLRDESLFDGTLDHFPAWGVWTSLVALAHEPSLWERFHGGEDCLLFRQKDFARPEQSALFQALLTSRHAPVKAAAAFLQSLLQRPPGQVPALDEAALGPLLSPRPSGPEARSGVPPLDALLGQEEALRARPVTGATPRLLHFFSPEAGPSQTWSSTPQTERQWAAGFLLGSCASVAMAVALSPHWLLGLGLTGGAGLAWARSSFLRQEPVKQRRLCAQRLRDADGELAGAQARLRQLQEERVRQEQEVHAGNAKLLDEARALRARMDEALAPYREGPGTAAGLENELRRLDEQERLAYSTQLAETLRLREDLQQQLARYTSTSLLADDALRKLRAQRLVEELRSPSFDIARLVTLDAKMKSKLRKQGIQTAADITPDKLHSLRWLPVEVTNTLRWWRNSSEAAVASRLPTRLLPEHERELNSDWYAQRTRLEGQLAAAKARLEDLSADVKAAFEGLRSALLQKAQEAREFLAYAELEVYREYAGRLQGLAERLKARSETLDALDRRLLAARHECAALHWRREEAARELAAHDAFRFTRYLAALFQDGPEST
jgi:hypothetical protein